MGGQGGPLPRGDSSQQRVERGTRGSHTEVWGRAFQTQGVTGWGEGLEAAEPGLRQQSGKGTGGWGDYRGVRKAGEN